MNNLYIKKKPDEPYFPEVSFNAETGICEIIGESFMEEPTKFYYPIVDWVKNFTDEVKKPFQLNINLLYFNTSTSKMILQMLSLLKEYKDSGGEVEVNWYYDPDDQDMKDEIEDYVIESGLEINKKSM